ncbi:cellulase, partial [Streptomyces sp. MCAF7]
MRTSPVSPASPASPSRARFTPRLRAAFVAILVAAATGTTLAGSPASAAPSGDTTQFRGVNWADPRDN